MELDNKLQKVGFGVDTGRRIEATRKILSNTKLFGGKFLWKKFQILYQRNFGYENGIFLKNWGHLKVGPLNMNFNCSFLIL